MSLKFQINLAKTLFHDHLQTIRWRIKQTEQRQKQECSLQIRRQRAMDLPHSKRLLNLSFKELPLSFPYPRDHDHGDRGPATGKWLWRGWYPHVRCRYTPAFFLHLPVSCWGPALLTCHVITLLVVEFVFIILLSWFGAFIWMEKEWYTEMRVKALQ